MTVTGKALGVWLSPDRTPYVDFDQLKAGGVEFIVALAGGGNTGDPLIDGKPTKVNGVDWFANVVAEAYRIDVPLFVQWEFHAEWGTNHDEAPTKQRQALMALLKNKTYHGIFSSTKFSDNFGKIIAPFWVRTRLLMFNDFVQKSNPHCWVGPIGQVGWRGSPEHWAELEPRISKDGIPAGSGPALAWMESGVSSIESPGWDKLPEYYPAAMPKKLPAAAGGADANWYWWCWGLTYALPGIWLDEAKTQSGNPWLCFFNGDRRALHRFAFYTSHGYTAPTQSEPETPGGENPGGEIPGGNGTVVLDLHDVLERIAAASERSAAALEKIAGVIK